MKKVLTIAGSDCSGGAGIQADLKTIIAHKCYGMSVITALTAQNTVGVFDVMDCSPEFVAKQIDCVFTDIFPDSVKIGMVSNADIIEVIVQKLNEYKPINIVIDPVMVSTSGHNLIDERAKDVLINKLLPLGTVITPNIPEAEVLSNMNIKNEQDMLNIGKIISKNIGNAVLIKGGHSINDATDILCIDDEIHKYSTKRVNNSNTHGTGCTLSSAIACNLALGFNLDDSIKNAKNYLTGAISAMLDLGKGSGPLDHSYAI